MDREKVEKGNELIKLIDQTKNALNQISDWKIKQSETNIRNDEKHYKDGAYHLEISEYGDGSGKIASLTRFWGNEKILKVIEQELERQLNFLEEEFKNL